MMFWNQIQLLVYPAVPTIPESHSTMSSRTASVSRSHSHGRVSDNAMETDAASTTAWRRSAMVGHRSGDADAVPAASPRA